MLTEEMVRCVDDCLLCYKECLATAMASPSSVKMDALSAHFRLMMACSEMCRTAAHFMLIDSPHHKHTCGECAEICADCANECRRLGGMEACVAACEACSASCKAMAA